jgi:hypothetical protein
MFTRIDETESRIEEEESPNTIYRYKLSDDFIRDLYTFSKIHQYDHRTDFKEAWNVWIETNSDLIEKETERLVKLDYKGDILDKMFKSARYYFRKKTTDKKEPQKRRIYVGVQIALLETMDKHINKNKKLKPSDGFEDFCKDTDHVELIQQEVNNLYKSGMTVSCEIKNKIKKTYKNRYFMLISEK